VTVAHTYNPSYSGGRDQEDHGSKATWANTSARPYLEKPFTKRAGGVVPDEGYEFKPQYLKKRELYKVKQCFTRHVGGNLGRLSGIYTMMPLLYGNSFDKKDLTLVDSQKALIYLDRIVDLI
jgi:hypothetical protein